MFEDPAHIQPARYLGHLLPGSKTAKFYQSKLSKHTGGKPHFFQVGNCVGGGSSINCVSFSWDRSERWLR